MAPDILTYDMRPRTRRRAKQITARRSKKQENCNVS